MQWAVLCALAESPDRVLVDTNTQERCVAALLSINLRYGGGEAKPSDHTTSFHVSFCSSSSSLCLIWTGGLPHDVRIVLTYACDLAGVGAPHADDSSD